jgi:hypothetical protein
MPLYKVKPERTIEHENVCYFGGNVVELASEYGAFHEPNILPYVAPVSEDVSLESDNSVIVEKEFEDEEETDQEKEKSSSLVWYQ